MARLTTEARNDLPDSAFAGPHRSFPVNDAPHARKALQLLPRAQHAGTISDKFAAIVKKRAKAKLGQSEPDADDRGGPSDNDADNAGGGMMSRGGY